VRHSHLKLQQLLFLFIYLICPKTEFHQKAQGLHEGASQSTKIKKKKEVASYNKDQKIQDKITTNIKYSTKTRTHANNNYKGNDKVSDEIQYGREIE